MLIGKELYRNLSKEAKALKDTASCLHYRDKIKSIYRKKPVPESSSTAIKRLKQARELLRQLQATNDGYLHSLNRTLETTYARRGSEKHSLLKPFILPSIQTSPSSFSPPLAALLTSSISHLSRPPTPSQLVSPPSLPPRAFPNTEESRLLGSLIPQRIKKIRMRYFNEQTSKLRAPITVLGKRDGIELEGEELRSLLVKVGLSRVDEVAGRKRLERLESLSKVVEVQLLPKRLQTDEDRTRKKEKRLVSQEDGVSLKPSALSPRILPPISNNTKWNSPRIITSRLLRRQYQSILQISPILTVEEMSQPQNQSQSNTSSLESTREVIQSSRIVYSVKKSDWAKDGVRGTGKLSVEDRWWLDFDKIEAVCNKK